MESTTLLSPVEMFIHLVRKVMKCNPFLFAESLKILKQAEQQKCNGMSSSPELFSVQSLFKECFSSPSGADDGNLPTDVF